MAVRVDRPPAEVRITTAEPRTELRSHAVSRLNEGAEHGSIPLSRNAGARKPVARHHISFVLPAYNEEANIAHAIDMTIVAARRYCAGYEVVVVDDGSSDQTAAVVEAMCRRDSSIRLQRHETNRGYGEALRTGFSSARLDYVFFTDADNQFDMNELPLLLAWADNADCVAGYRKRRSDPAIRRANAWAWNRLVRMLFCIPVRDVDCAFKLFRREALAEITIESRGAMINTEILAKLARAGGTIVEVGVTHRPRTAGEASGAEFGVIMRALREVRMMYPKLRDLEAPPSPYVTPLAEAHIIIEGASGG